MSTTFEQPENVKAAMVGFVHDPILTAADYWGAVHFGELMRNDVWTGRRTYDGRNLKSAFYARLCIIHVQTARIAEFRGQEARSMMYRMSAADLFELAQRAEAVERPETSPSTTPR